MSSDGRRAAGADGETWSVCPGCGVSLPGTADVHAGSDASEACWQLYGEVAGYELAHLTTLGHLHQLMVDAYGAQHTGSRAAPIGVAFALIGLKLALDEGWRGEEVRNAHRYLAARSKDWPQFVPPSRRGSLTAFDVALAESPEAHARLVRAWAAEVWASWGAARDEIMALIEARLPADVREQVRFAR